MFKTYKIIDNNLYLFIDEDSEFANEFFKSIDKNLNSIQDKITDYIDKTNINFKKGVIYLVAGGVLVSSIPFNSGVANKLNDNVNQIINEPIISLVDNDYDFTNQVIEEVNEKVYLEKDVVTIEVKNEINNVVVKNNKEEDKKFNTVVVEDKVVNEVVKEEVHVDIPIIEEEIVISEQLVTLYRSNGTVQEITMSDYLIGVVGAEMPASFNVEALKAQSVAARTYTLKRILNNQVLTDTTINQKYEDVSTLKAKWGSDFDKYYNKVKQAVESTKDEVITYNGNYIDALYHSTSNGKTEDPIYVWGNSYSYLKSVDSVYDVGASSYNRTIFFTYETLSNLLEMPINMDTTFTNISFTANSSIDQISINGNVYSGKYIRELLGLRSTDFTIVKESEGVSISTKGYGHGVGMSQYGANGMANNGSNYKQILTHYYTGVKIVK